MNESQQLSESARALLDRARTYCAAAEQCESGVRQKLINWGISPDDIDPVIEQLIYDKYIDDYRYTRDYCESKLLYQQWGRQKVIYRLRMKHIAEHAIQQGLESVSQEQYLEVVRQVLDKKLTALGDVRDSHVRQKLFAYMAQRGFTTDEINQAIQVIKNK